MSAALLNAKLLREVDYNAKLAGAVILGRWMPQEISLSSQNLAFQPGAYRVDLLSDARILRLVPARHMRDVTASLDCSMQKTSKP